MIPAYNPVNVIIRGSTPIFMSGLWNRMWADSSFVPASGQPTNKTDQERIEDLEKRVRELEFRLSKLNGI
ncbi:MAG: hypothetical protein CM15mV4_1000 [Caudoviricetes sp.]|nr:MAG: hypothetical protein CM15mV4_1000 [Caudoviricetes sp.]